MTLSQFQRAASFLKAQGIEPTLDMLSLEPGKWSCLMSLVTEYEEEIEQHKQPEVSEAEMEEDRIQEAKANLYHSA